MQDEEIQPVVPEPEAELPKAVLPEPEPWHRMRTFFRIVVLVLVLATVMLISALSAMRFAIHGREVAVPRMVGMTPAEAERAADALGIRMEIESRYFSSDVPEGRILSQVPLAGTIVRRGSRVRVAESLGPQRAVIPDVVGQSLRAAEINVKRRSLELGTVAVASIPGQPPGQVVAQTPPPSAPAALPRVDLLITPDASETSFVMPDLTGHTVPEIETIVETAGLKLRARDVPANGAPVGVIVKQWPEAGQRIVAGTVIGVDVTN